MHILMTCVEFMRLQLGISLVRSAQIEYLGRTLVCGEFGRGFTALGFLQCGLRVSLNRD